MSKTELNINTKEVLSKYMKTDYIQCMYLCYIYIYIYIYNYKHRMKSVDYNTCRTAFLLSHYSNDHQRNN